MFDPQKIEVGGGRRGIKGLEQKQKFDPECRVAANQILRLPVIVKCTVPGMFSKRLHRQKGNAEHYLLCNIYCMALDMTQVNSYIFKE